MRGATANGIRYSLSVKDPETPPETPELLAALREHKARFGMRFGDSEGVRLFFSPGRVNLMGAHLDYNGGPVMPTAIDRGTFLAVRGRRDDSLNLASVLEESGLSVPVWDVPAVAQREWYDYPVGVVRHLLRAGERPGGLDVLFGGNLAIGAGLSSSASICVGTGYALTRVWGMEVTTAELLDAALFGEREHVGVQCGIMDPYAVGLTRPGHLLWLECKDGSIDHLPLASDEITIAVADSGIRRELAQGEFNRRVESCRRVFELLGDKVEGATCLRDIPSSVVEAHAADMDPVLLRRARHVVGEVERTFAAREALLSGDLEEFGRLITGTHYSLRDLYQVSVPELDCLVERALEWEGCLGARLTGAGFGGCAVILLRTAARAGFSEHLATGFERSFGRRPPIFFFRGDAGPREVVLD